MTINLRPDLIAVGAIVVAILLAGAAIALSIRGGSASPFGMQLGRSAGSITVSATGIASAYPAEAVIGLWVNGSGSTGQLATKNLSLTLTTLNQTLLSYVNGNTSG